MASPHKRLDANAAGDFYVDSTCIDCATCRWMAPETYNEANDQSRVYTQPQDAKAQARALLALVACPTGSIGITAKGEYAAQLKAAVQGFPRLIAENVYHCGYHAENSFGAASYLILQPEGNIMIDAPRFAGPLVKKIETLGGIRFHFLTHKDDVADHESYHRHFKTERFIHEAEAKGSLKDVEHCLKAAEVFKCKEDFLAIPTPGHTRGSICYLYKEKFLFSGDHVAYSPNLKQIYAFRDACWYNWDELVKSMNVLAQYRFEWILPGHGWPCNYSAAEMQREMVRCLEWLKMTTPKT